MKTLKTILSNTVGVVLGYAGGTLVFLIVQWILLSLVPMIPIIPKLLSWPVDYEWYAMVGISFSEILVGLLICKFFCELTKTNWNYGVIILGVIQLIRYIYNMIHTFATSGFQFSILTSFGLVILQIAYLTLSTMANEKR
ncbi:MAG: hypothetical protein IJO75_01650 [Clostridia bacterium]|nr:hypothetical protein [Clostridia bacterium]